MKIAAGFAFLAVAASVRAVAAPAIFPAPRQMQLPAGHLVVDGSTAILLPPDASAHDLSLSRMLQAELSDRYGIGVPLRRSATLPERGTFLLLGIDTNPLVRNYAATHGMKAPTSPQGYALRVDTRAAVVAGADEAGAFYGLQSLRQLIERGGGGAVIRASDVQDWPLKPFRGIKMYLPGHSNIGFFKRFVRDFMALYKFNRLLLEVNAAMRLDRHPELNAGWLEFGRDLGYTRRDRPPGPGNQYQDSGNADTADGEVLEKEEVADLVRYAAQHHIEVIPEIPTLTHAYYLLARHRDLAEIADAEWPDTYCPSNPQVYPLVFDVLDEYIDVMKPRMIHIGHDEWRMPLGVCPRCRGKDPTELYARDLTRIYDHLRSRNVEVAIWGDHLIEALRGRRSRHVPNPGGTPYDMPGGLTSEQVTALIPKDILIFNWFWTDGMEGQGEMNDRALSQWGFRQVYGNFRPDIRNYDRRGTLAGVLGGAPSSWAATTQLNFGKDLMYDFLGCAELLWSTTRRDEAALSLAVQQMLPGVRRRLAELTLPSEHDRVKPLDLSAVLRPAPLPGIAGGTLTAGTKTFHATAASAASSDGAAVVPVGQDVSSLIFLHAAAKPAGNTHAYNATWNFADTADLLGWYDVVYRDGFTIAIPLRYGVNILEAGWLKGHQAANLAYEADLVDAGGTALFAVEWINPRFGIEIKEVRLRAASGYRNARGKAAPANTIYLAALSVVPKRAAPAPKPLRPAQ